MPVQRTTLTRTAHAVLGSDNNRHSLRPLPTSEIKRSQAGAEQVVIMLSTYPKLFDYLLVLLTRDLECSKYWGILAYIPLLIYSLWEAVPLTVYGKPYALGLG